MVNLPASRCDPRHGRIAGADEPRRPANARPGRQRGPYSRLALRRQPGPPERLAAPGALRPRPGDARGDSLLDDRALELREHAEHLEERLAGRRAGIDALAIEVQVNPGAVQLAAKAGTLSSVWMRSRREVR
jgi:hypothetical protein